jgi:hypothetical protein
LVPDRATCLDSGGSNKIILLGGLRGPGTLAEWLKNRVDDLAFNATYRPIWTGKRKPLLFKQFVGLTLRFNSNFRTAEETMKVRSITTAFLLLK